MLCFMLAHSEFASMFVLFVLCELVAHADLGGRSVAESIGIVFIVVSDDLEYLSGSRGT